MTWGGLFVCLMGTAGNNYGATMAFVVLAAIGIEVTLQNTHKALCIQPSALCTLISEPCLTPHPLPWPPPLYHHAGTDWRCIRMLISLMY